MDPKTHIIITKNTIICDTQHITCYIHLPHIQLFVENKPLVDVN